MGGEPSWHLLYLSDSHGEDHLEFSNPDLAAGVNNVSIREANKITVHMALVKEHSLKIPGIKVDEKKDSIWKPEQIFGEGFH